MAVLELDPVVLPATLVRTALSPRGQAIRGEYLEIPQLLLTHAQVQSYWDLSEDECDQVLEALLAAGFLKMTPSGGFVRAPATGE
jgi:hypothetical protein